MITQTLTQGMFCIWRAVSYSVHVYCQIHPGQCVLFEVCACLSAERGNVKSFETSRHPPAESLCSFTQCVHVYCHIRPGQCVYNTLFEVYVKSTCLPLSKSKVILNLSSPFLASLCSLTQNTSSRILPHPKALQNLETKITWIQNTSNQTVLTRILYPGQNFLFGVGRLKFC